MAQDGQVPPVPGDLGARVRERPPEVGHQRIDQRPPRRLVLNGQLRQRRRLRLAQFLSQPAQEPAVARDLSRGPLLQPVEQFGHGQRGEPAKVDLAVDRDRLGRLVPPLLIGCQAGLASRLPPGRVHRAAGLRALVAHPPRPQARKYRALAAAQHRRRRLPPGRAGLTGPGIELAAVPPDEPVPSRGRQHPGLRVPAGISQEPWIQQAGEPRDGRIARGTALTQHRRQGGPGRVMRCGSQDAADGAFGAHRVTPASSRGDGTASTAARSRAGSGCA